MGYKGGKGKGKGVRTDSPDSNWRRPISGGDDGHKRPISGGDDGHKRPISGGDDGHKRPVSGADDGHKRPTSGADDGHKRPISGSSRPRRVPPSVHVDKPATSTPPSGADTSRIVNGNLSLPWSPDRLSAESEAVLNELLRKGVNSSTAWVPMVDLGTEPALTGSVLGGPRALCRSEPIPVCLECKQSLRFVCQVDRASLIHPFHGAGIVQLFACPKCVRNRNVKPRTACWATVIDASDASLTAKEIGLITSKPGRRVVKWLPRKDFPHPLDCAASTEAEWAVLGEVQVRGDKIGGCPSWLRKGLRTEQLPRLKCKECDAAMRLLLTVDSGDNVPFEWAQDGCLMVFECAQHGDQVTAIAAST